MHTIFSCYGTWKLPNDSATFDGTLHYDPLSGAKLELFGTFGRNALRPASANVVLGKTSAGDITLVNCSYSKSSSSDGGIMTVYVASFVLVGYQFQQLSDIVFKDVYFKAFNLFEWVNTRALQFDDKDDLNEHLRITGFYNR